MHAAQETIQQTEQQQIDIQNNQLFAIYCILKSACLHEQADTLIENHVLQNFALRRLLFENQSTKQDVVQRSKRKGKRLSAYQKSLLNMCDENGAVSNRSRNNALKQNAEQTSKFNEQ